MVGDIGAYDFILSRSQIDDRYGVWRMDIFGEDLLEEVPLDVNARFDRTHQLIPIGRYLLEWGPQTLQAYEPCFPYRLFEFDPTGKDPLGGKTIQKGIWTKKKFWQYRPDFGNPKGANEGYDTGQELMLIPLGSFILNVIPTAGRGTFQLWNFDPNLIAPPSHSDPLPAPYTPQGSFDFIEFGHELIPLGNYVLDRLPQTGEYWLWSFDPQNIMPLALPAVQQAQWKDIDNNHKLVPIGEHVLDWVPKERSYRLWRFDPKSNNPLTGPVREGMLPEGFDAQTTLTGIQPPLPIDDARKDIPGTIDFMRSRIKHVVYLVLENRSFDHICGWLYEKGETNIHFVGADGPFQGASLNMFNVDPASKNNDNKVFLNKYKNGQLSEDWDLDFLPDDPYHDKTDVMRQFFFENREGYAKRAIPDMGGFVWNNGGCAVMTTYTPEQIPIINGLAKEFAVSDAWFSSMPGATDPNRGFAFTGSALGQLNNFQNGVQYIDWPNSAHRASIWKVLWANGISDWKIYHSVEWMKFVHTYHLFLQGQIPSVDAKINDYIASIHQFKKDALAGKLPAFSFLEPAWIAAVGTTSYHPGADLVPGERAVNEIYEVLKAGPNWDQTLFVISFDEHGGLYDHVAPPYAENPWPNDVVDGFRFDIMGVRVPAVVVSPWIERQTVFRSTTPVAYDSTSVLATLLQWCGIPRSRWGLGDRTHHAPSFEGILQRTSAREDKPSFTPPYDQKFPQQGEAECSVGLHSLHRLMAPRLIWALAGDKLTPQETGKLSDDILARATNLKTLHSLIQEVANKYS